MQSREVGQYNASVDADERQDDDNMEARLVIVSDAPEYQDKLTGGKFSGLLLAMRSVRLIKCLQFSSFETNITTPIFPRLRIKYDA